MKGKMATLPLIVAAVALACSIGSPALATMPSAAAARAAEAGNRLFREKRYLEAIVTYDKVLSGDSTNGIALTMRAFAYVELGDNARALNDFDAAWNVAPESPNAWSNACWGRALANADLDRALKLCDSAIKANPSDNKAFDTRGFLHLRRGEFDAALSDYSRAVHEYRTASSLFGRGIAKSHLGKDDAKADQEAALKLDPAIAEIYAKRGMTP